MEHSVADAKPGMCRNEIVDDFDPGTQLGFISKDKKWAKSVEFQLTVTRRTKRCFTRNVNECSGLLASL